MRVDRPAQILHRRQRLSGAVAIAGVVVFVAVLGYLHAVQFAYDPVHQFMSELAFGVDGGTLVVAFLALAMSLMALANGLASLGGRHVLPLLLVFSALCFAGAGLVPLGASAVVQVSLVGLAFVAVGLAMYLLPSCVPSRSYSAIRWLSWGLLALLVACAGVDSANVPSGISQRLAACVLLTWIVSFGGLLLRWR